MASLLAIERSSRRMILPERVFGKVVAEADFLRLGHRSDLLANPRTQLGRNALGLVTGWTRLRQHDECGDRLASRIVRPSEHRR
jgi:hypothetical protein